MAATAAKPVMLYSIGKDSSVMLRLAEKAYYPGPIPFPLMHIDTGWKFREMIAFRDQAAKQIGFKLITYTNPRGVLAQLSQPEGKRIRKVNKNNIHNQKGLHYIYWLAPISAPYAYQR